MTSRAEQVLELYREARVRDQLRYYEGRRAAFTRAYGQLLVVSAVLLGATSTVSALAGTEIAGKVVWAVLAAVLPAVSTALAAYGTLFGFDRHAKLYDDAVRSLDRLDEPDLAQAADADTAVTSYIAQVEDVLRSEQSQWGQLVSERRPGEETSPADG